MNIHPDLVRLRAQYERIVADYTAGNLDDESAKAALLSMRVFDASGAAWGINLDGMYVRQRSPQEQPEVVPPTLFAIQQTGGAPQPGRAPWEEAREAGVPFAKPVIDPGPPGPSALERAGEKLKERAGALSGGRISGIVSKNKITLIVAAVLVVLLVVAKSAGGDDETVVTASPTSSVPNTSVVSTSSPVVALPDAQAVLSSLEVLKNRQAAVGSLGDAGSLQSAFWAGLPGGGFLVEVKAIDASQTGATASLAVKDSATGVEVGVVGVALVLDGGSWRVAAWPDVSALFKKP